MTYNVTVMDVPEGGVEALPPVASLDDAKAAALDAGWFVTGAWIEENRIIVTADGLDVETDYFGRAEA